MLITYQWNTLECIDWFLGTVAWKILDSKI